MKKLFTIGLGQCFGSIIPVMVWAVMGKLHGDAFANGMAFTYPYQFIFAILWHATYVGNIKHGLKDGHDACDFGRTGILVGMAAGILVTVVSVCNMDMIGGFLGVSSRTDRWAFLFGIGSMAIDWPAYYLGEQYQYYGDDRRGTRFIAMWYILKLALVCITAIPMFGCSEAVVFILTVQAVILVVLMVKHGIPHKMRFSLYQGMRYTIHDMFYNAFMTVIYLFGIHGMSVEDISLLAAFNLMVLCTDTQWDVCGSAIDILVTTYVCDGTFEKRRKKIFGDNLLFSLFMAVSCYGMLWVMLFMYKDVDPLITLIFISIELSTMVPYGAIDTMTAYIGVQYPNAWTGILTILKYTVRITAQSLIPSPYAISIALPVAVVLDLPFRILLYRKARKKAIIQT